MPKKKRSRAAAQPLALPESLPQPPAVVPSTRNGLVLLVSDDPDSVETKHWIRENFNEFPRFGFHHLRMQGIDAQACREAMVKSNLLTRAQKGKMRNPSYVGSSTAAQRAITWMIAGCDPKIMSVAALDEVTDFPLPLETAWLAVENLGVFEKQNYADVVRHAQAVLATIQMGPHSGVIPLEAFCGPIAGVPANQQCYRTGEQRKDVWTRFFSYAGIHNYRCAIDTAATLEIVRASPGNGAVVMVQPSFAQELAFLLRKAGVTVLELNPEDAKLKRTLPELLPEMALEEHRSLMLPMQRANRAGEGLGALKALWEERLADYENLGKSYRLPRELPYKKALEKTLFIQALNIARTYDNAGQLDDAYLWFSRAFAWKTSSGSTEPKAHFAEDRARMESLRKARSPEPAVAPPVPVFALAETMPLAAAVPPPNLGSVKATAHCL